MRYVLFFVLVVVLTELWAIATSCFNALDKFPFVFSNTTQLMSFLLCVELVLMPD